MKAKMSPYAEILSLYKMIRKAAKICGADIWDPKYKMNIITICMLISIAVFFVFAFYTVCIKFEEDWKIIIEAFCLAGGALQGTSKFLASFFNQKLMRLIKDKVFDVYEYYEKANPDFRNILRNSMKRIKATIVLNVIAWMLTGISMPLIPAYYNYFKNEQILMIQFLVPKIDPNTTTGYISLFGIQSTCIFFGLFGNVAGDTYFILHALIILVFQEILQQKVIEFNELLNTQNVDKMEVNEKFRNIIKWTQDYFEFSGMLIDVTFIFVTVEIFFCGFSSIFSIYIIMTGNWPAAYPYFLVNFMELYIYSYLGTAVEIAADKTVDILYEIEWYRLDLKHQKTITLMLMRAQNKTLFTVGGIVPLSVNTALQVTKTIYSFIMMLLNFVD